MALHFSQILFIGHFKGKKAANEIKSSDSHNFKECPSEINQH